MSYHTIETICQQLEEPMTAGEAHGMATALLCVDDSIESVLWLSELLQDSSSIFDEQKEILLNLFEQTRELIAADDFTFELLLPDDDSPLPEQAEAVKTWCQGFVYGIGLHYEEQKLPGDSREIVKDIIEFSKLDSDIEGEEDENSLVEIIEYLRMSVPLMKEELR
jgi:yecA family protein